MPKTHSYGASYPSGTIIGHDGAVETGPDEGNDASRIEDDSRPGGAGNANPIDQEPVKPAKATKRTSRIR